MLQIDDAEIPLSNDSCQDFTLKLIMNAILTCSNHETRVSQVGFNLPKLTLSMRVFGPRNSAYAFWDMTDIHIIYIYNYISREISTEHPSVRLASLAQIYVYYVYT